MPAFALCGAAQVSDGGDVNGQIAKWLQAFPVLSLAVVALVFLLLGYFLQKIQCRKDSKLLSKNREKLLAEKDAEWQLAATALSDEMSTQAAAINASSKYLQEKLATNTEEAKAFRAIRLAVSNISENMEELLFSGGGGNIALEQLLQHLQRIAARRIGETDIRLQNIDKTEFPGNLGTSQTGSLAILRIFKCAIDNALQHSRATFVKVQATVMPGNILVIKITDNGRGFDMDTTTEGEGPAADKQAGKARSCAHRNPDSAREKGRL